jgi:hypothetical protein
MHLAELILPDYLPGFLSLTLILVSLPLFDFLLGLVHTGCRLLLLIGLLIGRLSLLSLLSRASLARLPTLGVVRWPLTSCEKPRGQHGIL